MARRTPRHLSASFLLSTAVLTGCGAQATAGSQTPPTHAAAVAFARAVNLRPGDITGMTTAVYANGESSRETDVPPPNASEDRIARCYLGHAPTLPVARLRSVELSSAGPASLSRIATSEVEALPTEAAAERELALYSTPRGERCIAANLPHAKRFGKPTITRLADRLPAGARGFGLRVATPLLNLSRHRHITIYKDVFGFVCGPADIQLTATGFTHPLPSATEQHVLLLLYRRASENKPTL